MTDLIVALDGPHPLDLANRLIDEASVRWLKIGPSAMTNVDWPDLITLAASARANVFLDLKLADTQDAVRRAVTRFAEAGISAVSTFTNNATDVAVEAARGSSLRVWQVFKLTDDAGPELILIENFWRAHGAIVPPWHLSDIKRYNRDIICPAVRLHETDERSGHRGWVSINYAIKHDATHIVVGRPIWAAVDPITAARTYLDALSISGDHGSGADGINDGGT